MSSTGVKKVINKPEDAVREMLEGFLLCNPQLARLDGFDQGIQVVVRRDWDAATADKVALISGGGSGHEPAHAGYVGAGMLTAAVAGNVYASPSVAAVLAAIRAVGGDKGVLLIVKNYTGDRLNFGLAAEKAQLEGIPVETVYVADDAALDTGKITGRRGIAGTVFVHKIAGAAADAGLSLKQVAAEAQAAADAVSSLGVALSVCTVPGSTRSDRLDGDIIEIGLGIHGEPGASRSPPMEADALTDAILERILDTAAWAPSSSSGSGSGGGSGGGASAGAGSSSGASIGPSGVALLVNNLGGTPGMEISIVVRRAVERLAELGIRVTRLFAGPYMTALEMAGFSLSVMPLTELSAARLDARTSAPAWPAAPVIPSTKGSTVPVPTGPGDGADATGSSSAATGRPSEITPRAKSLEDAILGACNALIDAEPELTRLDTLAGDGDCGNTMKRGATAVSEHVTRHYPVNSPADTLGALGATVRASMDGTSGALYDIMCLAAERQLRAEGEPWSPPAWAAALRSGVNAVMRYGNAKAGFRTMVDALLPACAAADAAVAADPSDGMGALKAAATAAMDGASATAKMEAGAGRASYVEAAVVEGVVDAGAFAVATWLKGAAEGAERAGK